MIPIIILVLLFWSLPQARMCFRESGTYLAQNVTFPNIHSLSLLPTEDPVTLVAGAASLLCICGDGDKFRLELERNEDIVKLFDSIKSYR